MDWYCRSIDIPIYSQPSALIETDRQTDRQTDRLVYLELALQVVVCDGVVLAGASVEAVADLEDGGEQGADERIAHLHAQLHRLHTLRQPRQVPTCRDRGAGGSPSTGYNSGSQPVGRSTLVGRQSIAGEKNLKRKKKDFF